MSDEQNHEHEHHSVNYTAIFGLLCVCTVLSILFDLFKDSMPKPTLIVLIFGVALCKATFVLLYFMHIRFEAAWKYVLLAPTAVLACALPFALAPDIAFHYYNVIVPQGLIAEEDAHAAAPHGHDDAAKHEDHKDEHGKDHGHPATDKTPAEKSHK